MQTIRTSLFEMTVPDIFENPGVVLESIRATYNKGDEWVTIGVSPIENSYYTRQKGQSLKEKFINFCLNRRGPGKLQAEQTLEINGHTASICRVITQAGYFFYFGTIAVDEAYSVDFVGDCESHLWESFLPLFETSFLSIRIFGAIKEAAELQRQGISQVFGGFKKDEEIQYTYAEPIFFDIPQDNKEYFQVDGKHFSYLDTSETHIPLHGNTGSDLVVTLKARIDHYDEIAHAHILNDYQNGEVYFTFSLNNIYREGVPKGAISFEKDYDVKREAYLWKGGFTYNLELFGQLVLKDGWIGMNGYFQTITEDTRYQVSFAKKIPLEVLSWEHYHFSSLEELFSAPVNLPRHLRLRNFNASSLPDEFYNYTSLETLSITYDLNSTIEPMPVNLPARLGSFTRLKELVLGGWHMVENIPEEISALYNLRLLFITGTQATSVPPNLLALPLLEYCNLSNNKLEVLPGVFSPSLKSLSLEGNQLRTVPSALCDLPKLGRLDISRNPLEFLPNGIENIEKLTLELEKKQDLLDYTYKGADGKGTVPIQETVFSGLYDTELEKQLSYALMEEYWEPYREGIRSLAFASVALETTDPDDYSDRGNTRFGGLPDLPCGITYPVFTTYDNRVMGYQFIAQINCEELASYQNYLPRQGLLYFFITDQEDFNAKVIYAQETDVLISAAELEIEDDFIYDDHGVFAPYRVKVGKYVSVPHFYNDDSLYKGKAASLSALEEEYEQTENLRRQLEEHTLSVKPVHSMNSYVFKQHDSPQIEAANQLRGNANDFTVLLKVSSDRLPGFCFWDAGEIYFVIHKSDLAKADFSNVYCGLESS